MSHLGKCFLVLTTNFAVQKALNGGPVDDLSDSGGLPPNLAGPAAWLALMTEKAGLAAQDHPSMFPLPPPPYWPFGKLALGNFSCSLMKIVISLE